MLFEEDSDSIIVLKMFLYLAVLLADLIESNVLFRGTCSKIIWLMLGALACSNSTLAIN